MEKKQIKISLATFIESIIAIILVAVIIIMGIHISNQNKALEESQIAMANKENALSIEKNTQYENKEDIVQTSTPIQNSISLDSNTTPKITKEENITDKENNVKKEYNVTDESKSSTKVAINNEERKNYILQTASSHCGNILSTDIDYNLVLESRIDGSKNINDVSNYATTMKWSVKNDVDYSFKYPSNWNIEKIDNGVERYRISGKSIGKIILENGENGDKVVEQEIVIVVYEPVIFSNEEALAVTWKDDGYNGLGQGNANGLWWTQVFLNGKSINAQDNYTFIGNNANTKKLVKFRILTPNTSDNLATWKTTNIINYFIGEFRI